MVFGNGYLLDFDHKVYKEAIKVERLLLKLQKCECNLSFRVECRDENVLPKFAQYKQLKNKWDKHTNRYYQSALMDEIYAKNKAPRALKKVNIQM